MSGLARWWFALATVVAAGLSALIFLSQALALRDTSHPSGWTLLALSLLLLGFGIRKKLAHPPLLPAGLWLRLHLGAGVVALVVFLCHLRGWPDGRLEWLLFWLFTLTALSGVVGWLLSRTIPRIITAFGEEVIYERIPLLCREIRERAQQLVVAAAGDSSRSILGNFYRSDLAPYFAVPMPWWRRLGPQTRGNRILHELRNRRRYLAAEERSAADELEHLISRRALLDAHRLWQGLLKAWLFAHIPLACALLIMVVVHLLVVQAFSGAHP